MMQHYGNPDERAQQAIDDAYHREIEAAKYRRQNPAPEMPPRAKIPEPRECCGTIFGIVEYPTGRTWTQPVTGRRVPWVTLTYCAVCRPDDRARDLAERGLA